MCAPHLPTYSTGHLADNRPPIREVCGTQTSNPWELALPQVGRAWRLAAPKRVRAAVIVYDRLDFGYDRLGNVYDRLGNV